MRPGRVLALLVRVPVDGVVEEVRPDAAVVEERVALAGCPVADDVLALAAKPDQQLEERALRLAHSVGEPLVGRRIAHALLVLPGEDVRHCGRRLDARVGVLQEHAERPSVARKLFDVDKREPLRAEDRLDRVQREVREVLVVDRVVLEVLDQFREVRELERRRPRRREQGGHARDEVVDVRDLGEHVVSEDEIGRTALLRHPPAELRAEELRQCLDAARHRGLRHVQRGLDAEHRDAVREKVLEEVAVVRRDLDDEAVMPESQALDHVVRVAARVLDPRIGVGGEVRVLREDVLGRHELRDLDEPAFSTRTRVEWVEAPPPARAAPS